MNHWKKRSSIPHLSPEEKARQGQAVRATQAALTSTDAVRGFLNTHQSLLGGRPLDVAIESAGGLVRVEQFLAGVAEIEAEQGRTMAEPR
ncbi:MAG TPA: hypothetical protein VGD10_10170 [Allosphingosinicella sp.]|uniref:hypothetical protein n=1 Tax=Allosphingosinicella sp. TaxID=2823234 RepID=UPI002ED9F128